MYHNDVLFTGPSVCAFMEIGIFWAWWGDNRTERRKGVNVFANRHVLTAASRQERSESDRSNLSHMQDTQKSQGTWDDHILDSFMSVEQKVIESRSVRAEH